MSLMKEFKEFAMRGNVVDLAVAVVIGGAFGQIVNSLVKDIIMPLIGVLLGGVDFSDKKIILSQAVVDAAGQVTKPENALTYGVFIQAVINFLIIAFSIFIVINAIKSLKKAPEEAPAAPPEPSAEEKLLTEIRDLLKRG